MPFHIETQEIRVFKAVIEENGFGRAADKLFVTQSAVSQTIANLERKLDIQLLERNPLKLTQAGVRMLHYAETVLLEESGVLDDIRDIKQGVKSTLSLASSSTVNYLYGDALLQRFCHEAPLTRIKLAVMPSRQIYTAIPSDVCEIGFGPFRQTMPDHLSAEPMFEDVRELVISTSHPGWNSGGLSAASLTEIPLIVSHLDAPDIRPAIEKLRDSFGTIWEVSDLSLRVNLVAQGIGMTYLDRRIREAAPGGAGLAVIDSPAFARIPLTFGLFYRHDQDLSPGGQHFLSLCQSFDFQ